MRRNDIFYHLYPLGFLEADDHNPPHGVPGPGTSHRLNCIVDWLDYLVDLGATGLLLGPVFASQSHGYDVVDPFRVDSRLGDETDLVNLITDCHDRSLSVALDLVLNHVGRGHPYFVDVLTKRQSSAWIDWFVVDFQKDGYDGFSYETFEGHGGLVKLNHSNPQVLTWAVEIAQYWIQRGADAFRLDAAYAIPTTFLSQFADRVLALCADMTLLGEIIHGDYASFIEESRLTTVTQYELWKAIWSSLNDRNFFELAHAMNRHKDYCRRFTPWNFVGNHDTTRIASKLTDPRHRAHALAVLFTLPGLPAVYAGDEQGAKGVKYDRVGGDAEIRKPPPYRPAELAAHPPSDWRLHRDLIELRRGRPWLSAGRLAVTEVDNRSIIYEVRSRQKRLIAALSTDDRPIVCNIPSGFTVIAGDATTAPGGALLPPHGWGIWSLE